MFERLDKRAGAARFRRAVIRPGSFPLPSVDSREKAKFFVASVPQNPQNIPQIDTSPSLYDFERAKKEPARVYRGTRPV
jgi:hypothetical protein